MQAGNASEGRANEKKNERESLEWRELLKSARPLKFSPVVNYPKKGTTVEFDHSPASVTLPLGF